MKRAWNAVMYAIGVPFAVVLIAILEGSAWLHRRAPRRGRGEMDDKQGDA